ncbi:MAG: Holliday junction branch migration protein RuvA [Bacteroidales bacterium]|nr:Holliday junction branch migration protein RuvA [Bacteroidales bacterium]
MYNYISGEIAEATPSYVVIDNNGIGYLLEISLNTYTQIKDLTEVKLLVHYVVREDAHLLYGFFDEQERSLFRNLINVNGVGVSTARVMLSTLNTQELTNAIVSENVKMVQSIKGIGPKTAQRIVLELHDKLTIDEQLQINTVVQSNKNTEEALSALVMLGFVKGQASKVLDKIAADNPTMTVEDLIKQALKVL